MIPSPKARARRCAAVPATAAQRHCLARTGVAGLSASTLLPVLLLALSAIPVPAQTIPEDAQIRALLTCVGEAAGKGVSEQALRDRIPFLCAMARAPVTVSCSANEYLFRPARSICARQDREFWTQALIRAHAVAGHPDDAAPRIKALTDGCAGVMPGPADPVDCLTNAIWRDWATTASGALLDILAARQADNSPEPTE